MANLKACGWLQNFSLQNFRSEGKKLAKAVIFGSCLNKLVWTVFFCCFCLFLLDQSFSKFFTEYIQLGPVLDKDDIMTGKSLRPVLLIVLYNGNSGCSEVITLTDT